MTVARHTAVVLTLLLVAVCAPEAHDPEVARIAELMDLKPGMQVADVGAGDGEFGVALARRLGGSGHVYIQEIDDGELKKIRKRVKRSGLDNLSAVEGAVDDTRLPEACCDAILLRFVYHHMSEPEPMLESLGRSLRSGGLLVVIERGERGGHGVRMSELIPELTAAGFRVVARHPNWNEDEDLYAVVFRGR